MEEEGVTGEGRRGGELRGDEGRGRQIDRKSDGSAAWRPTGGDPALAGLPLCPDVTRKPTTTCSNL